MRVLLLCHGLPPASVGGVEQHVDGLAGALVARGCEVHVYARADARDRTQGERFAERTTNPAITRVAWRWEGIRGLQDLYEVPLLDRALASFLDDERRAGRSFDVAHVHHLTGLSTGSMQVLGAAGIPTVLTLHDYWLGCPRGQMFHYREEVCERLEPGRCGDCLVRTFPHWLAGTDAAAAASAIHARARAVVGQADQLVVPSARMLPFLAGLGVDPARVTVVENGVDTTALQGLPPPAAGPGPLRVGYLGTLIPSKGLHVLVAAVQALPAGTVEVHVSGNAVPYHGDHGYLTRVFGALRPEDRVHYHGPYPGAALPARLAMVDVVAAPALWHEAFGLTVREALAAGRPVLVSRIGGLQDAVADGVQGMILPPGDVPAWTAALADLARDRERVRAMAAAARPRARGFLAMADDLVPVYAGLRRA